jgi:hypothetical protein
MAQPDITIPIAVSIVCGLGAFIVNIAAFSFLAGQWRGDIKNNREETKRNRGDIEQHTKEISRLKGIVATITQDMRLLD